MQTDQNITQFLTKGEIADHLGLRTPAGRINYYKLRIALFTPAFLQKLGLTEAEYKQRKIFTIDQAKIIMNELNAG